MRPASRGGRRPRRRRTRQPSALSPSLTRSAAQVSQAVPSACDVHRHEAPELSGFWVPLKVIDDPDGDGRVLKAGCAKRFDQSACQGVSIDADNSERLEVYAFGRLPDPVVED